MRASKPVAGEALELAVKELIERYLNGSISLHTARDQAAWLEHLWPKEAATPAREQLEIFKHSLS